MKQCWPEGDLRAYLDGELAAESRERIAAHLEVCSECGARSLELSERAARVSNLMALLPAVAPARIVPIAPAPARHWRRWAATGLGLAAALAITFVALPKRTGQPVDVAKFPIAAVPIPVERPVEVQQAISQKPAVRHAVARRPAIVRADFLRLDDEPLETGTVVRVSAENGNVQADLIVGPDGRAHAIRVISNQ